jgi:hypothetical protein
VARLRIEVADNEDFLYDVTLYVNDVVVFEDTGYTSEGFAFAAADAAYLKTREN